MKEIKGLTISKTQLPHTANTVRINITGTLNAVFSLQIRESEQNKFYNFNTNVFENGMTSEHTLSNVTIYGEHEESIKIPINTNGNTYTVMLFAYSEFDTKLSNLGPSNNLYTTNIIQSRSATVRFSTSTDQAAESFIGIGAFTNNDGTSTSVRGAATQTVTNRISISKTLADSGDGLALGYKYTLPSSTNKYNSLADSLQPRDMDFFTKVTGQTDGTGTDSTSMILDNVDNLVVGMDLVDIADSADEEQSGSLGVLTYPTITAIDINTRTITLSAAPDWGDDKAVVFRAYGSDLISKSTGGTFSFDLTVAPVTAANLIVSNWGKAVVNGDVSGTSIAIDGINGVSVGSKIIGSGVTTTSSANLITAVHSSGTPITVTGTQTLSDNTELRIYGSSSYALIKGTMIITAFPTADTDVYYDIDRAFIVATNS